LTPHRTCQFFWLVEHFARPPKPEGRIPVRAYFGPEEQTKEWHESNLLWPKMTHMLIAAIQWIADIAVR
jgi:hypothetical protein